MSTVNAFRQAERQRLRERIARAKVWNEQREQKYQVVAEIERKIEFDLPQEYEQKTQPLQSQVRSLENAEVERMLRGDPPDPKADARRRELRQQINAANSELELSLEAERNLLRRLKKELNETVIEQRENVVVALENQLVNAGDPVKLLAMDTSKRTLVWASNRCKSVQRDIQETLSKLAQPREYYGEGTRQDLQLRLQRQQAELVAAEGEVGAAQRSIERLRLEILAE